MRLSRCAIATLLAVLPVVPAMAQENAEAPVLPTKPTFTFYIENDNYLGLKEGEDRFYTNGLRLAVQWPECYLPETIRRQRGLRLPFVGDPSDADARVCPPRNPTLPEPPPPDRFRFSFGAALGQNFYTPSDIKDPNLRRNDRPYAAWLYVGAILNLFDDRQAHTLELDLGTVGPRAQGEWVQSHWHRLIDAPQPRGWAHQISDEPALLLLYDARWRLIEFQHGEHKVFDLIPSAGGALGNVLTYGKVGATARLGWNIGSDFGPPGPLPSAFASRAVAPQRLELYLFAGAEGRGVVHNIFLDGNTFQRSHAVAKEDFVADLNWGIAARLDSIRLTWRQVRRSPEFIFQRDPEVFGAVTLTWGITQ